MIDRQFRGAVGLALIVGGVIVGVLGYLGVSRETEVAFQLPYFASAGVAALMLFGAGAGVLLSAQLERDSGRLDELEEAIRQMADEVRIFADEVLPARTRQSVPAVDLAAPARAAGGRRRTAASNGGSRPAGRSR